MQSNADPQNLLFAQRCIRPRPQNLRFNRSASHSQRKFAGSLYRLEILGVAGTNSIEA
ncbi:hypothetical protein KIP88_23870 [Bradyrhizobium sp. SRL28]|uniref:hypothetical protein n=1 Tax=Bradyrhizobium sp. SRL28 TaxID=2836178 RepID=UPI001BDEEFA7|nr:hypothetical protein [Bradyrhizobium sp. SRL28]MBT1513533.1 hypothetical protein [Bradyrhizobium sp. SRL28]